MRLSLQSLVLSLLAWPAAGCVGTSTGNPAEQPNGEGGGGTTGDSAYCKRVDSQPVALDEQTELGFSANDVLAFVQGAHQETLTWYPDDIASYGPESGAHALTLTVTRKDTPVRLTHFAINDNGLDIGGDCPDALEIDVEVALTSDQGALDEHLDVTLQAHGSQQVALYRVLKPADLGGSFAITEVHQAGFALAQLNLSLRFTRFGTSGTLTPTFEQHVGGAVGTGASGPLASWGPPACDFMRGTRVPRDAQVAGFSGEDAIALLSGVHGAQVSVDGASAVGASLAFSASAGGVCALLEHDVFSGPNPVGSLFVDGVLTLRSSDGRIDAAWPVELVATARSGGGLDTLTVKLDQDRLPQTGTLLERFGVTGLDDASYDFSNADLELTLAPPAALKGELTITGFTRPDCPTTPVSDPNGGTSIGGCPGATPHVLAHVALSAQP